jgi:hypothetical protein
MNMAFFWRAFFAQGRALAAKRRGFAPNRGFGVDQSTVSWIETKILGSNPRFWGLIWFEIQTNLLIYMYMSNKSTHYRVNRFVNMSRI